jgi:hypothetical protein
MFSGLVVAIVIVGILARWSAALVAPAYLRARVKEIALPRRVADRSLDENQ